ISGFSVVLGITFSTVAKSTVETTPANLVNSTLLTWSNATTISPVVAPDSSSAGDIALMVFRGPLEMAGGILIGIILGVFLWFIPSPKQVL
uniref:Uncharacterized protein n=1 Tax=Ciona savignyi TaxID=51511 RepID=H2Z5L1_CIOSA